MVRFLSNNNRVVSDNFFPQKKYATFNNVSEAEVVVF